MSRAYDIVVVGAGPAGLAAATAAAGAGRTVAVLDDNPRVGGQIWRAGAGKSAADRARARAEAAVEASGAELFAGCQVIEATRGTVQGWMGAEQRLESFQFESLILATGARERFLPFPGWTLPGVFGAGGLQALVRGGYDVRGKRVVVAGTGPLLLAVAAHLKQDGAEIVTIAEQAPMRQLTGFATSLLSRPGKVWQGMQLRAELASVPYRTGCWIVAAEGSDAVTGVRLTDGSRTWTERCDLVACGFHLVPNTELALLLECRVTEIGVEVNAEQQTSVKSVYCAGEPTGIAGADAATVQGKIAGLAAAGKMAEAPRLYARRDAEAKFGRAMTRAFALRSEVLKLAAPDTIVCRCEDVRFGELQGNTAPRTGWTDAKLQTRCGMGPCQGRICGPALEALFGWRNASVRPPVFPIPVAALCSAPLHDHEVSILENIGDLPMNWFGVMPAVTTPFDKDLEVDHAFLAGHTAWLLENGCTGLVLLGSLGEGATLEHDEKVAILKTAVKSSKVKGTPVVAAVASLSTRNAVQLAKDAEQAGCNGLMVLPPYVYSSDWREMKQHVAAVISATKLPCMVYNNPIAYKTDFLATQIAELAAEHANLQAVKESSADVRRVMAIRELLGERLKIFVGVDDVLVEAVDAGATGWVAGLVNAFPRESVELFDLALAGKRKEAYALYKWFLPLLRMDPVPKFVQLIKWVQEQTGTGRASVRAPRVELAGAELEEAKAVLKKALAARPAVKSTALANHGSG